MVTADVDNIGYNEKKPWLKPWQFSRLAVEAAKLEAKNKTNEQIQKILNEKWNASITIQSIDRSLNSFNETAPHLRQIVGELSNANYWTWLSKYRGDVTRRAARARIYQKENAQKLLRQGRWPYGRKKIHIPYQVDEEKNIQLPETEETQNYRLAINDVAHGDIPYAAARKHGITPRGLYRALQDPFFKGYIETEKGVHPALAPPETWDKAHEYYLQLKGRPQGRAPPGTKRLNQNWVPNDPDDIIGQIVKLRVEKEGEGSAKIQGKGYTRIAKALKKTDPKTGKKLPAKIGEATVAYVLKHVDFYVKLGMINAEMAKNLEQIRFRRGISVMQKVKHNQMDKNRANILKFLRDHGPSRIYEMAQEGVRNNPCPNCGGQMQIDRVDKDAAMEFYRCQQCGRESSGFRRLNHNQVKLHLKYYQSQGLVDEKHRRWFLVKSPNQKHE